MNVLLAAEESALKVLPEPDELLFGSIAFAIVAILLIKFIFPKLNTVLTERTARIQGQLEEAERTKRDADQVLAEYRAKLEDAGSEVAKIIEEGRKTADQMRADLVARAEVEAREIVTRAQAEVAGERDRAVVALRDTLGDLSIQLASRVIGEELRGGDRHRALVDRAIADLAGSGGTQN